MTQHFRVLAFITALGIFGSAYSANAKMDIPNQQQYSKTVQLNELLSVGENFTTPAAQFTFTTTGTIHFLKADFYNSSNSDCSGTLTLLGSVSVIDNGAGFPFNNTQAVNFNPFAAYKLIQNQGQNITPSSVKCMKIYLTGGNDTNNNTTCMAFNENCATAPTCSATSGLPQAASWSNTSQTPCTTPSLYLTNSGLDNTNPNVLKCIFGGSGTISSCTPTGTGSLPWTGFNFPTGIALNNGYAYIGQGSGTGGATIDLCQVDSSNGALINCATEVTGLTQVTNLALSTGFYFTGEGISSSNINYGSIDQGPPYPYTGIPTSLGTQTPGTFSSPQGISINNGYIYMISGSDSQVFTCAVNSNTGVLSTPCVPIGSSGQFQNPKSLTIYNGYIYILGAQFGGVRVIYACPITSPTTFGSCTTNIITSYSTNPVGLIGYNNYIYFTDANSFTNNGYIGSCQISSSDSTILTSCRNDAYSGHSDLNSPYGLAVY